MGCFIHAIGNKINPYMIIYGISKNRISFGDSIGLNMETIPITDKRLNKLEPIILPIDMACSLRKDAITEVASSGRDVPNATIDIPITISLIPKYLAISIAPFINKLAPNERKAIPEKINIYNIHRFE
jgi:hypothetical protein